MAKVRFLTGPKAGTIEHIKPQVAETLAAAGLAEIIPYKNYIERLQEEEVVRQSSLPQVASTVNWTVGRGERNGRIFISAQCSNPQCGSAFFFDGAPAAADKLTFIHSCSGTPPVRVPAAVVEKYRKLHFVPSTLGADEASYHYAARPQPSQVVSLDHLKGPLPGVAVNPKHSNYGISNYAPDPSDGKPADLSKLKTQFAQGKK
jgi:hypothetical protein